jgi:hypothetical protein
MRNRSGIYLQLESTSTTVLFETYSDAFSIVKFCTHSSYSGTMLAIASLLVSSFQLSLYHFSFHGTLLNEPTQLKICLLVTIYFWVCTSGACNTTIKWIIDILQTRCCYKFFQPRLNSLFLND